MVTPFGRRHRRVAVMMAARGFALAACCALAPHESAAQSIPTWATAAWDKESVARTLERGGGLAPAQFVADFDGDGRPDVAWFVVHRTTGSRGILIVHASGRTAQQCGAGVSFGNGGDNFDWMDSWQLVPRRFGPGFALLVEKSESASGRIEFRQGRYRWYQGGD